MTQATERLGTGNRWTRKLRKAATQTRRAGRDILATLEWTEPTSIERKAARLKARHALDLLDVAVALLTEAGTVGID